MKKGKTMIALLIFTIVLAVALVIVCVALYGQKKQNDEYLPTIESQNQTINALQDEGIIELIEYAKSVMNGEVFISDESNPLWYYSYRKSTYPEMKTIEISLEIVSAKVERDKGELVISYSILYLDDKGETVRRISVSAEKPTIWYLEKQDGEWTIVDKLSYP